MRKSVKMLTLIVALAAAFLIGWRVMPKVWPTIKTNVLYPVFPTLEPTPAPTQEPYQPYHNASIGDDISETDSLIYYFYKPYCPYCMAIDPLMSGLPKSVTLSDGTISDVKLIAINKLDEEGGALIAGYYETYAIAEDVQYVPAVVIGGRHLMPGSEIIDGLMDALVNGEGLKTPLIDGSQR